MWTAPNSKILISGVAEDFLLVVLSVLDTFVLVYISDGSGIWVKTLVIFLLGNPKIDGELMFIPKKDAVGSEPSLYDGMVGEVDSFVSWYW
jgi:hypothetical protein